MTTDNFDFEEFKRIMFYLLEEDYIKEPDVDTFAVLTETANEEQQWTEKTMQLLKQKYGITLLHIPNLGTGCDSFKILRDK
jgi:hypothetical protein